jgi:hypothetical protein
VKYRLEISRKALEQLRALPKEQRQNIGHRIEEMREGLRGDFKPKAILTGSALEAFACSSCLLGIPSKCMLSKIEKKPMTDSAVIQKVEELTKTVERLLERVEDLEDLRDLQTAIAENGNKPLIPWKQANTELNLE